MQKAKRVIELMSLVLLATLAAPQQAMSQDAPKPAAAEPYPKIAPIEQYLMADRDAEIALARSAAPASISRDATVLVLGRKGYETAVEGKNGFVCVVARSWTGPFDWPEFWNPKIRAADCLNPQAARAIVPIYRLRATLAMAGRSKAEILSAVVTAYKNKQLPALEGGAMDYMMSKSSYLTDEGDHNMPHVMFDTQVKDAQDWGANLEGSPVMGGPYWFLAPEKHAEAKALPNILVFLVGVGHWSDGTPAEMHAH
ncbi:hypothetical protein RKE25_12865 [Dyella sp. BiH032]|uniref:hypothetical protein n=1 Tax=Dyella sp. BiH032 TaxID=3075430 RepID=UPI002893216C|nr:hypothetical protein [Dyella sp. BiH032]WNL44320.1 hypothetical protein RKE25_12865 [Dyella sp. BiH032]